MEGYLIKASVLISLYYLVYMVFLRKTYGRNWGRIYLVTGLVVSGILPLLPSLVFSSSQVPYGILLEGIEISEQITQLSTYNITSINPLQWIYIGGVSWFFLRLLSSVGKILFFYFRFPKKTVRGTRAVMVPGEQAPYTFFHLLFISPNYLEAKDKHSVLDHELAHILQGHSYDVIATELMCIILWFNPVIWLYKLQMKLEHELSADRQVMKKGYNLQDYKQQLFQSALGIDLLPILNYFNHSYLKKRLEMLNKSKYTKNLGIKFSIALAAMLLVSAFSLMELEKNNTPEDSEVYDTVEVMPEYPGGITELRKYIASNLVYPEIAAKNNISAKVFIQFVVNQEGKVGAVRSMDCRMKSGDADSAVVDAARQELEQEAIRVVSLIDGFTSGYEKGKTVAVRFTMPIVFKI